MFATFEQSRVNNVQLISIFSLIDDSISCYKFLFLHRVNDNIHVLFFETFEHKNVLNQIFDFFLLFFTFWNNFWFEISFRIVHSVNFCRNWLSFWSFLSFLNRKIKDFIFFLFVLRWLTSLDSLRSISHFPLVFLLNFLTLFSNPLFHVIHDIIWFVNQQIQSHFLNNARYILSKVLFHLFYLPLFLHIFL